MPTALLAGTVQPPALTLLSTDGPTLPPLWRSRVGSSKRAAIQVLRDTAYPRAEGRSTLHVPKHRHEGNIEDYVVHLQSPRVGDTYIEIGGGPALGASLPWLGAQVKQLGRRAWALEVEISDTKGRRGRMRFESSRKDPSLLAHRSPPILLLPLAMPTERITEWSEVVVNLNAVVPLFRQLRADDDEEEDGDERKKKKPRLSDWVDLPEGRLGTVDKVRVYANARVRRVWLSTEGGVKDEWDLVGAR